VFLQLGSLVEIIVLAGKSSVLQNVAKELRIGTGGGLL
jgi:hypothetical protein